LIILKVMLQKRKLYNIQLLQSILHVHTLLKGFNAFIFKILINF